MIYAAPRIRRQRLAGIIPHLLFISHGGICLLALDSLPGLAPCSPHTEATPNELSSFLLIRLAAWPSPSFGGPCQPAPPPLRPYLDGSPPQQYPCQYKQSCKHTCSRCGPSFELVVNLLYVLYISVCKCIAASVGDFFYFICQLLLLVQGHR